MMVKNVTESMSLAFVVNYLSDQSEDRACAGTCHGKSIGCAPVNFGGEFCPKARLAAKSVSDAKVSDPTLKPFSSFTPKCQKSVPRPNY